MRPVRVPALNLSMVLRPPHAASQMSAQTLSGPKDLHTRLEGKENDPAEQDSDLNNMQQRNCLASEMS